MANVAPEGEFSRITDYVGDTQTLTISPALTTAIASGDRILIVPSDFPLYDMIEVVNDALKDLVEVPKYDTSITTASAQTEYTLPVAVKGGKILNVEVQGITTDANDNRWLPVPNWKEYFAAAGSTGVFYFPQYASSYNVRITYNKWHPRVSAYSDPIDEFYHPKLVEKAVFAHALAWRNSTDALSEGRQEELVKLEQQAWSEYQNAKLQFMPEVPHTNSIPFPSWSEVTTDRFRDIPYS